MEVYQRDEYFAVVGTLHDERPWAGGDYSPRQLHIMELGLVVRRADMTIGRHADVPPCRVHRH
jgi:hypothetical protein